MAVIFMPHSEGLSRASYAYGRETVNWYSTVVLILRQVSMKN